MYISQDTACCATAEIDGLSEHDDPREAMLELCNEFWQPQEYYDYNKFRVVEGKVDWSAKPSAFYIFTAVVEYKKTGRKPTYGQQFAAYIRDNNLGAVTETKAKPNRVNHPDHLVKVWVWAPNEKNLKAWYRKNMEKEEE